MSSTYTCQNIRYTGTLKRISTSKGSILSNNGTNNFELTTPTTNGENLTSDLTSSSGIIWSSGIQGIGFGFATPDADFPAELSTNYFLLGGSTPTSPPGLVVPQSTSIFFSIRPGNGTGWASIPTNITGGTIDFNIGYVPANTSQTIGNWVPYNGTVDFSIVAGDINTGANQYRSFIFTFNISASAGQQFSIRVTNNLTSSADPMYSNEINGFIIFRS